MLTSLCLSGSLGARNPPRGPNPSMAPCTSSGVESTLRSWRWRTWRMGQVGPAHALPEPSLPTSLYCVGFSLWWLPCGGARASVVAAPGLWSTGSVVNGTHQLRCPVAREIFPDRDPDHVPYIDHWIILKTRVLSSLKCTKEMGKEAGKHQGTLLYGQVFLAHQRRDRRGNI